VFIGIGDVWDVPVSVVAMTSSVFLESSVDNIHKKFLMFIGIGDVWDIPVGVGSCYVTSS
jgi:hypothetical protein